MKYDLISTLLLLVLLAACTNTADSNDPAAIYLAHSAQFRSADEYRHGEMVVYELREMAEDLSVPDVQTRFKKMVASAEEIDRITREQLVVLDQMRINLLKGLGADVYRDPARGGMLLYKFHTTLADLRPSEFDLGRVKYKGRISFIASNTANGRKIVSSIQEFRGKLVALLVSSQRSQDLESAFFFKDPMISDYKDAADFYRQMDQAMRKSHVGLDDQEIVKKIYFDLSHNQSTWKELLHEDCSWITAFQLLTTLQTDVLKARTDALTCLRSRVGGDNYSFNQILVMTPGPEYAKPGTEVEFSVLIAAYDSNRQPIIQLNGGGTVIGVQDGKGIVRVKVPKCREMTITGTISILNKSSIPKTLPWSKTIVVGE